MNEKFEDIKTLFDIAEMKKDKNNLLHYYHDILYEYNKINYPFAIDVINNTLCKYSKKYGINCYCRNKEDVIYTIQYLVYYIDIRIRNTVKEAVLKKILK